MPDDPPRSGAGRGPGPLVWLLVMLPVVGAAIGAPVGLGRAHDPSWSLISAIIGAAFGGGLGACLMALGLLALLLRRLVAGRAWSRGRVIGGVLVLVAILALLAGLGEFLIVLV